MISVQGLTKRYGNRQVLQDLNVEFVSGKLTALIGPNGAGKSSLLMCIARLLTADSGRIFLSGRDMQAYSMPDYAKQVATLCQFQSLQLQLKVRELVAFGRFPHSQGRLQQADHHAIAQALDLLGLTPLQNSVLHELSGGQRQLAFMAMVVAQQTPYLLLDEPLNNLDLKHAVQLMQVLSHLRDQQQKTVIVVLHDLNMAANYADRVVAMQQGCIRHAGEVGHVMTAPTLSELYQMPIQVLQTEFGRFCHYFNQPENLYAC